MNERDMLLASVAMTGLAEKEQPKMVAAMAILVPALESDDETWNAAVERAREVFPDFNDVQASLIRAFAHSGS